jgi:dTDP-D-glucose 4,6-dehydratase
MIWLWTILFQGEACRPYNVGSEQAMTMKELAEKIHDTLQLQEKVQIGTGGTTSFYVPNTKRAKQELGLKEWVSLEESIRKYVDWINNKTKNLFSKLPEAANNCIAPVLASSSIDDTLSRCAPSTPCSSSPSAIFKTVSKK